MTSKTIPPYSSQRASREYIASLKEWVFEHREHLEEEVRALPDRLKLWVEQRTRPDSCFESIHEWGRPDDRDFPGHHKGDVVLVVDPRSLYKQPYVDNRWPGGGTVNKPELDREDREKLKGKRALVTFKGSGIDYYDPWEDDVQLVFENGFKCFMDAFQCDRKILFLPHLNHLDEFELYLKYFVPYPKSCKEEMANVNHLLGILKEYYAKFKAK